MFLQAARKGGGLTMHDVCPIGMGKQVHGEVLSIGWIMGVHGNPNCRRKTKNLQGFINCLKFLSMVYQSASSILGNPWHFIYFP